MEAESYHDFNPSSDLKSTTYEKIEAAVNSGLTSIGLPLLSRAGLMSNRERNEAAMI
jgi:hypothetical protein